MVEIIEGVNSRLRVDFASWSYAWISPIFPKLNHPLDHRSCGRDHNWKNINNQDSFRWWKSVEDKRVVKLWNGKVIVVRGFRSMDEVDRWMISTVLGYFARRSCVVQRNFYVCEFFMGLSSTQYASRLLPTYKVYEIYCQPGKVLYFKG